MTGRHGIPAAGYVGRCRYRGMLRLSTGHRVARHAGVYAAGRRAQNMLSTPAHPFHLHASGRLQVGCLRAVPHRGDPTWAGDWPAGVGRQRQGPARHRVWPSHLGRAVWGDRRWASRHAWCSSRRPASALAAAHAEGRPGSAGRWSRGGRGAKGFPTDSGPPPTVHAVRGKDRCSGGAQAGWMPGLQHPLAVAFAPHACTDAF